MLVQMMLCQSFSFGNTRGVTTSPKMTKDEGLNRELRQDSPINDDEWYDDFHYGNFAFDDASPLVAELQATPWTPSYKPP
jgi:hypothetical protein